MKGSVSMKLADFEIGLDHPFFLIAGPCVLESEQLAIDTAGKLAEITGELGIPFIFKSSYDKANRTSGQSYRGLGMEEGLQILDEVRRQIGVAILQMCIVLQMSNLSLRSLMFCRHRHFFAAKLI